MELHRSFVSQQSCHWTWWSCFWPSYWSKKTEVSLYMAFELTVLKNGIHSQLFCPGQGYRQCPPPPYSMTRWSKNQHQKTLIFYLMKIAHRPSFDIVNFYFAGGGTKEQQKHDTPSKFWQYGWLWLRRRRGEAKRPKEESQPATYEAKTNRPQECKDDD